MIYFRFNVKFSYYTTTIGIDPGYSKENFYDKEMLPNTRLNFDYHYLYHY